MVRPQIVAEFFAGDFVAESSDGTPKTNPLLSFEMGNGYDGTGNYWECQERLDRTEIKNGTNLKYKKVIITIDKWIRGRRDDNKWY